MKKTFAMIFAGSMLFAACGGAAGDVIAIAEKASECKKLKGDEKKACRTERKAMEKEIGAEYAGFSKEEMVEVKKEAREAMKGFKCE
jgi:hypothetical protein